MPACAAISWASRRPVSAATLARGVEVRCVPGDEVLRKICRIVRIARKVDETRLGIKGRRDGFQRFGPAVRLER